MLFLEVGNLAADAHALREQLDEVAVHLVDLTAERLEAFSRVGRAADDQVVEDDAEHLGRDLLCGVAPRLVGVGVALDDESVEAEVHGLLRQRGDELAPSANVAGVAEDGQLGDAATQLDGHVPHGQVAVDGLLERAEAAVDGGHPTDACGVETLHAANPELQVGVDGVFVEHRHIHALQGVSQFLYRKGVGTCAGTNPQHVDAGLERQFHMVGGGHFGTGEHARLFLHAFHPGQGRFALTLKASGLGAGLPYAGAEYVDAGSTQLAGCLKDLLFGFGTTWAGDKQGAFGRDAGEVEGL